MIKNIFQKVFQGQRPNLINKSKTAYAWGLDAETDVLAQYRMSMVISHQVY